MGPTTDFRATVSFHLSMRSQPEGRAEPIGHMLDTSLRFKDPTKFFYVFDIFYTWYYLDITLIHVMLDN